MFERIDPFLNTWRWPAIALAAALGMLGAAHALAADAAGADIAHIHGIKALIPG